MDLNIPLRTILWISVLANGFLQTEAQEKCGGIPYADGTGRESLHMDARMGHPLLVS